MFREQTKPFLIKVFFVFCSSNKDSFSVPPTLNSVTPSDSSLDYFPLRAFVAQFSAQKLALMPFSLLYRHFLCAILAPHFVGFSPPYRTDAQPQKHTSTNYAPPPPTPPLGHHWSVPAVSLAEDEQRCSSKPSDVQVWDTYFNHDSFKY